MSKTFIVILVVIGIGVAVTLFGMNQNKNTLAGYETALAACGLAPGNAFTDEELRTAQKCACKNGDKISCNFGALQQ